MHVFVRHEGHTAAWQRVHSAQCSVSVLCARLRGVGGPGACTWQLSVTPEHIPSKYVALIYKFLLGEKQTRAEGTT